MEKKFSGDICSDIDYEDLIANVYYDDHLIAILSQEKGFDNLEIEIFPSPNGTSWKFNFSEFEQAVLFAKKRLWELRKVEE